MGEHKHHSGDETLKSELKRHEEKEHDILAKEQPLVLESSETDPTFPAMEEFEVDEGGPAGSTSKHPGILWIGIACVAVIILIIAFVAVGDWA